MLKKISHVCVIVTTMLIFFQLTAFLGDLSPCLGTIRQFNPTLKDPTLVVEPVLTDLSKPTTMAFIGPDEILVLQKNDGQVRRIQDGILQPDPVLDVAVNYKSERGLLGVALDAEFPIVPYIYLYYTESSTGMDTSDQDDVLGNRVYRYTWNGEVLIDPQLILDLPFIPGPNHDGGIIIVGPDDKLYVIIGDLNRNGQLQNFAENNSPDDTSVILRLNRDGTTPEDNPFFNSQNPSDPVNRYYAYGIRNSFGMAFDPVTGYLWDTENGPSDYDEINLVPAGFNSGWEQIMGPDDRTSKDVPEDLFNLLGSVYSDPEFSWGYDAVGVTSLAFHTSSRLGEQYLQDMFVGDTNEGYLYHFELNTARDGLQFSTSGLITDLVADSEQELEEIIFGENFGTITDIETGPDGWLYICSYSLGTIFRIRSIFETTMLTTTTTVMTDTTKTVTRTLTITLDVLPEIFLFSASFWASILVFWGMLIAKTASNRLSKKK